MGVEFENIAQMIEARDPSLVEYLIRQPGIDTDLNARIIDATPFIQTRSGIELYEISDKVERADKLVPDIRRICLGVLERVCGGQNFQNSPFAEVTPQITDWVQKKEKPSEALKTVISLVDIYFLPESDALPTLSPKDKSALIPALSQVGAEIAGNLYRGLEEKGLKELCKTYLYYYVAVQHASLGIRTGSSSFAIFPDEMDMGVLENIFISTSFDNLATLKKERGSMLLEGDSVTPVRKMANGYFFISRNNPNLS